MGPQLLEYLTRQRRVRSYATGDLIFRQGENPDEIFYLVSGLSLTYTVFEDGRERNILITWPGRLFGASTFFERAPRRSSAIAIKPCQVAVMDRKCYEECCRRFPGFQEFVLRELSRDIGALFEEIADSSMLSADVRVARFFCRRLAEGQYSKSAEGPQLQFSQEFLAQVIGLSRVSVSQVISSFVEKGWIATGYRRITILDQNAIKVHAYGNVFS